MEKVMGFILAVAIGGILIFGVESCHRACEICSTTPVSLY